MTILQSGIAQAAASGGYQIARSLRFNSADTAYLSRTPASNGNRQIWTLSAWVKRSAFSSHMIYGTTYGSVNSEGIRFNTDGTIIIYSDDGNAANLTTTPVYRDSSAWYHVVVAVDTTQATSSNRVKLYVNGTQVTVFGTATYPTQNFSWNTNSTTAQNIGRNPRSAGDLANGYMTEMYMIDGQQLTPTSFGETDTATGVWMPKQVTGMTYGTNGFYLNFSDNSGVTATTLGKDSSGNSNNWTPNNFSVTAGTGNDSLVDSPTNYGTDTGAGGEVRGNYATWNPLRSACTLTNGNLQQAGPATGGAQGNYATIGVTSGKWYFEVTVTAIAGTYYPSIGISTNNDLPTVQPGVAAGGYMYMANGQKFILSALTTYGASFTANDVIGVALDMDAGTLTFYKNGTSQGQATTGITGTAVPVTAGYNGATAYANFGQRPFAYTAPSGFKALCTQNLPTPAIGATSSTLASKNFDATLYTGTGSNLAVAVGFQPDLIWTKARSAADNNILVDAIRGIGNILISNATNAESAYGAFVSFDSNGFTKAAAESVSSRTYVAWNWKGGNGTVSNTSGTITSTVSANSTAGISVVGFAVPASGNITVGHGLGVTPAMIIVKGRGSADNWAVWHKNATTTTAQYLRLNGTDAVLSSSGAWGAAVPNSTVFGALSGTLLVANQNAIAYCFAEVAGFSKFGSYTGNGSADGPFVYCGFRPRYVMIKRSDAAGDWWLIDTARSTYNVAPHYVMANTSAAEASDNAIDVLSNGFKLRVATYQPNTSGGTFIFAAFAEAPFNYARAR